MGAVLRPPVNISTKYTTFLFHQLSLPQRFSFITFLFHHPSLSSPFSFNIFLFHKISLSTPFSFTTFLFPWLILSPPFSFSPPFSSTSFLFHYFAFTAFLFYLLSVNHSIFLSFALQFLFLFLHRRGLCHWWGQKEIQYRIIKNRRGRGFYLVELSSYIKSWWKSHVNTSPD
jgi:hypothetical protein